LTGTRRLQRAEVGLVATAGAIVFSRVFGLSLVLAGFRPYASGLLPEAYQDTQVGDILVGFALSAYGVTLALMQLPLGLLSDRIGRRPVLLGGAALFVAGSALAAVATDIWVLIAARLVQGLGAVASVAMAAVGETVPAERRTTAMAFVGIPAGLGFVAGLVAGAALEPALGIPALFGITAALGVATALPLFALKFGAIAPDVDHEGVQRTLSRPVTSLLAAGFATNFALTTAIFFLPDVPLGRWQLVAVLAVAFAILAVATRSIDRRARQARAVTVALAALGVGTVLFVGAPDLPWALLGGVVFFASHAILSATLPSEVSRIAGRAGGRGHGIQNVVAYSGTALAGPIAGGLAGSPLLAAMLATGIALAALAYRPR
jgi:MFS family permease